MATEEIVLNEGQSQALARLIAFIDAPEKRVFILKGYAGTGKTTLMRMLLNRIREKGYHSGEADENGTAYHLLASTGRAAKILANITGDITSTVHGMIYSYSGFNEDIDKIVSERQEKGVDESGQLLLVFAPTLCLHGAVHIYIIDEASMISDVADKNPTQALFGTGRLLNDLLKHDPNGKFIFVGDACQLPPILQKDSPALNADYFIRTYGIGAEQVELTEVVRQEKGNDIVVAAQRVRHLYFAPQPWKWAKFPLKGCQNIHLINSEMELLQHYIGDIKKHGYNASTMITLSNRKADSLTSFVRPMLGIYSQTVTENDLLLVTQNNIPSGLMNGDLVRVVDIGETVIRKAGLTFLKVSVEELFTHRVRSQLMIADILYMGQTNLSQVQQKELFVDFHIRMKQLFTDSFLAKMEEQGIEQGTEHFEKEKKKEFRNFDAFEKEEMLEDPFLNALRCVYGYVLTCHKSQGGEWDNVYLDIPRSLPMMPKPYVYQWVYTAMTRAKKELYVTNDFYII